MEPNYWLSIANPLGQAQLRLTEGMDCQWGKPIWWLLRNSRRNTRNASMETGLMTYMKYMGLEIVPIGLAPMEAGLTTRKR